ncbi:TIM barrel protein, partial [Klebsiella michiganensis]
RDLAPLFAFYGIQGLVEPLGFPQSSLRSSAQAQTLIHDARVPFKLLIDTFHHHLYPQAEQEFNQVDIGEIGLVHLSGVEDTRPREALTDNERIMLTAKDQLQSCEQVKNLEARGYQGVYAFEPFAPELANWSEDDIRREIEQSIALIQRHCA